MPRSIWSGAISFGLVNVPVKLYSAVSRKAVRFHQLHDETGSRIQQKRVDPTTGEEVSYEHLVKGYEISPDRYVVITPEELESLDPEKTRTIDILDFVDLEQIDPIYYDHPYYLIPGAGAEKAFTLLREAMEQANKVAIAKVVIRSKESLVAIRPTERLMTMSTMLFHDEVVDGDSLDDAPEKAPKTTKRELEMAQQLIDSLAADFEPERYRDEYRERVMEMIERKAQGEEIAIQPAAEEPARVPDLMAALEASISAVKSRDEDGGDGAASKRSSSAKRSNAGSGSSANGSGKSGGGKSGSSSRSRASAAKGKSGGKRAASKSR
jgi:DNA end-binding protein Ku